MASTVDAEEGCLKAYLHAKEKSCISERALLAAMLHAMRKRVDSNDTCAEEEGRPDAHDTSCRGDVLQDRVHENHCFALLLCLINLQTAQDQCLNTLAAVEQACKSKTVMCFHTQGKGLSH